MDEPEAALSPQRQLTLLLHIVQMAEAGSQFIIVTHSPILLGIPDAEILRKFRTEKHAFTPVQARCIGVSGTPSRRKKHTVTQAGAVDKLDIRPVI